jgi:hypothetical protein
MKVTIKSIKAGTQQIGEVIVNTAPLVVEVNQLRQRIDDVVDAGHLPTPTADALQRAAGEIETEATSPQPRRSRLKELLAAVTTLTTGVAATSQLTDSVEAVLKTLSGAQ